MTQGITSRLERIESTMTAAGMAWWELEFPSGALSFSKNKAEMLGYDSIDFVHFSHFTDLIHPDDITHTMQAMKDHYTGKEAYYEARYRIRASDGSYKVFYDKGSIVERRGDSFIVAGMVVDVTTMRLDVTTP